MTPQFPEDGRITAIIPARNEELVIRACVESLLPQVEIAEILVVDDHSMDATVSIVQGLAAANSKLKLLSAPELPAGWVGKNNAVWTGSQNAQHEWLLFTDADAVHEPDSSAKALSVAKQHGAEMVSFSSEQVMESWYEKSLIPYVYCRLSQRFRFEEVNDPSKKSAAANGQFILVRRKTYVSLGGHAAIAGEVLEDVALAAALKQTGNRIWFGSGKGIVRVRMYRSFSVMWEGWKKNLYPLMGGEPGTVTFEIFRSIAPLLLACLLGITTFWISGSARLSLVAVFLPLVFLLMADGVELKNNGYSVRLAVYSIPGRVLFAAVLGASHRGHLKGRLQWKGRTYPAGTSGASKDVKTQ